MEPTIINKVGVYRKAGRSWYTRKESAIKIITVHHTAGLEKGTDEQILKALAQGHYNQGWPGLAYHYIILKNGMTYRINNHTDVTWHDGHNWDSIGVCVHGYFHPKYNEQPTEEQLKSLKKLLDWLCTKNPQFPAAQGDVYGHRERLQTACPGDTFFPKVKEYREKRGAVSWGADDPYKERYNTLKSGIAQMMLDAEKQGEYKGRFEMLKTRITKLLADT